MDGFRIPSVRSSGQKFSEYPSEILGQTIVDDRSEMIENAIQEYLDQGADIVVCTGGMSVDPDDLTPGAIGKAADRVVSYGAPVLPGCHVYAGVYRRRPSGRRPSGLCDVCPPDDFRPDSSETDGR